MIARVRTYSFADVIEHLGRLDQCLHSGTGSHDIVAEMKHMVPEFKSNNSIYQEIDSELSAEDGSENMTEIQVVNV